MVAAADLKSVSRKRVSVRVRLCPPIYNMKTLWRIWAKALGEKASENDCEADKVAIVRTLIVLCYVITNFFIVAGVIKHWHD